MTSNNHDFDAVLTELRQQGLEVTVCSALKETWYIKGSGIHIWYIATGAELLQLKRANKLNLRGIKSLDSSPDHP